MIQEHSLWRAGVPAASFPSLNEDLHADVCVVGAGIAGLSVAYCLAREGKSVVVLEAGELSCGQSGNTSAHITAALDDGFHETEKIFGTEKLKLTIDSHLTAIDTIESIVRAENIDCDFERISSYLVALSGKQEKFLQQEVEAAARIGLSKCEIIQSVPLQNFPPAPALCFPQQATFHMKKYLSGLARSCFQRGVRLYFNTHVSDIERDENPAAVTDDGYIVRASNIVLATHQPQSVVNFKQEKFISYVVAFEIPKDSYPGFLLCDLEEPYHYASRARGKDCDYLLVGGADHKAHKIFKSNSQYKQIITWASQHFPNLGNPAYCWRGEIMEPFDHLAFIGREPGEQHIYVVTGDSGNGITHGTIAGKLVTDLIQNRDNPWANLYNPGRASNEKRNFITGVIQNWRAYVS